MVRVARAAAALLCLQACDGCKSQSSGTLSTSTSTSTSPSTSTSIPIDAARPPCRAIAVTGDVRFDGDTRDAVSPTTPLGDGSWLAVLAAANVTVKDPRTAREVRFDGPASVRVCVGGEEESWMSIGTFHSTPATGERPGGEEWVATPFGVVRYAAENLDVVVDTTSMKVSTLGGGARVWAADGVASPAGLRTDEQWVSPDPKKPALFKGAASSGDSKATDRIVAQCGTLADAAAAIAAQIAAPGAPLGDLAPKHVVARRAAHAACAVAAVRVTLGRPDAQAAWLATIAGAEKRWRALAP
jgi:hypothetical protein